MDLLLDRAAAAQGDGGTMMTTTFANQAAGVSNERVAAAERVLRLLDAMPLEEPSPDLVWRTLERIGREAPRMSPADDLLQQAAAGQPVA